MRPEGPTSWYLETLQAGPLPERECPLGGDVVAGVGNCCRVGRTRRVRSFMIVSMTGLLSLVFFSLLWGMRSNAEIALSAKSCDAGPITVLVVKSLLRLCGAVFEGAPP